jgi:gluconolactonase
MADKHQSRFALDQITEVTNGLQFPEGPIAMPDGTVVLVEMFAQRITRVHIDGTKETVAEVPGGPNGLAVGPDGAFYVCNNGGAFTAVTWNGLMVPGGFDASAYIGGRIQRVDAHTGEVTDLYTHCDGRALRAPNDLVMDGHGGFWFTDHGIRDRQARTSDITSIYYARADGSEIREVEFGADTPNGIGLSPDGTKVYWAETHSGRVLQRTVTGPGQVQRPTPLSSEGVLAGLPGMQLLDSLAVDGDGNVCVATIVNGGITVISADGATVEHVPIDDAITTNICFGGEDLRTAYITASSTGRLLKMPWPVRGLKLAHL